MKIVSVKSNKNHLERLPKIRKEESLIKQKENLKIQLDKFQAEISTLNEQQSIIKENSEVNSESSVLRNGEQLKSIATFYQDHVLNIKLKLIDLKIKETKLREKLNLVDKQLGEEQYAKNNNTKDIDVEIYSPIQQSISLDVSFISSNAGWRPSYDIKATNINSPIELIYKAKVYQNTGMDWNNVAVSLSTYTPNFNQNRPILNPKYVDVYDLKNNFKGQVKGLRSKSKSIMTTVREVKYEDSADAIESYAAVPKIVIKESQMNIEYQLNHKITLPFNSDGKTIEIKNESIPSDFVYHVIPEKNTDVFLLAKIKDWQSLNLIQGDANIYFENNYIGKTYINPNFTGKDYLLSLGVDSRIVVKRNHINKFNEYKSLNSKQKETYTYEYFVRNNSSKSIKLEIIDQIPIAKSSKIKVIPLELSGGVYHKKTGSVKWEKNISSGTSQNFIFSYEIKYPKDNRLIYRN